MRLRTLCLAALTVPLAAAPPASAGHATFEGGCNFNAVRTLPASLGWENGRYAGEMDLAIVLLAGTGGLADGEVTCELRVNGITQDSFGPVPVSGAGVAADVLTFSLPDERSGIEICTLVDFADGSSREVCGIETSICLPDCWAKEIAEPYVRQLEADTCADLGAHAPGTPGMVDIAPEGDVHVGGVWVFDCPPYGPY